MIKKILVSVGTVTLRQRLYDKKEVEIIPSVIINLILNVGSVAAINFHGDLLKDFVVAVLSWEVLLYWADNEL